MNREGRVLFVILDVYQEDNHFPLGVAYMAAILKKEGVDVKICCQDIYHYSNDELAELFLKDNNYDLIGIGFMAARFNETVLDLCDVINANKKEAWLVLGGYGPSPIPEYMLNKTKADIIAIGEAEETIVDILDCKVNGNKSLSQIEGIAYREGEKVFTNNRRKPILNLNSIPFPEWSLFPMDKYSSCLKLFDMVEGDKALGILSTRGCVNRCNFCYRMEKGIRARSIDNLIEEIKILNKEYRVNCFTMEDDLFLFSKKRVFAFQKALQQNKLEIKFDCGCRTDIFDEDTAKCLKESGCTFLSIGFESTDQNVLNRVQKNTTVEENIRAAEIANKVGIGVGLNFIWGNIGDTEKSLRNNVEFIKKYNTYDQIRTIRPVTPYPGCDLYYDAIKMGLLAGPEDFFKKFRNSDLLTVNFTNIPDKEFYDMLFEANKELILDHYQHTTKDMRSAYELISDFRMLYDGKLDNFRGARHYSDGE